jgi:hypothetical protein
MLQALLHVGGQWHLILLALVFPALNHKILLLGKRTESNGLLVTRLSIMQRRLRSID